MVNRLAFTMIELIFSIVIISFAVLSLPMMNQVIAKNIQGSIAQEAIFAASTELTQAMSLHWAEESIETNTSLSRVVWSAAGNCGRVGHINQEKHRRCTKADTSSRIDLGSDPLLDTEIDDLDDISANSHPIFINYSATSTGYKDDYNSTLGVDYADFGDATVANANMKRLSISISDSKGNVITSLSTFSANIGEIDYLKRSYP